MKRSEMIEGLFDAVFRSSSLGRESCRKIAEHQIALIEQAGVAWDPEEPEWPELFFACGTLGSGGKLLTAEQGIRIANAWNARRPGGEMERRLRVIAETIGEGVSGRLQREIEAALLLGVEP
jgi:hypothetical protein